ncbi:MAG: ribonucleoside-triphosphate reductase, adenosylcobalamin-dependent [Promethearchaeota archaeon]
MQMVEERRTGDGSPGEEPNGTSSFIVDEVLPRYVITARGDRRPFDWRQVARSLVRETGLSESVAQDVAMNVIKRIIGMGLSEVSTSHVRELTCVELTARGLLRERNQFVKVLVERITKVELDEEFISRYRGKQPDWGVLGYVTYKRTYARNVPGEGRTEEFWETARRCVEGAFSSMKLHCKRLAIPWDEEAIQADARRMFEKIWNFKFLPPGRGLWMMGTKYIDEHGSMALNNCGFVSTADLPVKGSKLFCWVMDALMLGVGVGFDTKGAGKLVVKEPVDDGSVFVIPDSREGWVQALGKLLDAYFFGAPLPEFDFSQIRPAGSPIRGFGGTASGPEPLREMLADIRRLLDSRVGQPLTSTDIVDVYNLIGKCVVAGNVRRSAEIALGDPDDEEYVRLKQDEKALKHHRWASNNSIFARKGMDYSFVAEQMAVNGEPGVLWLENARAYSRMDGKPDWKDKEAAGVNPCGEQTLESFELCCLVETFPSRHDTYEEYEETLRYAYLYAKSVTLLNTHWPETNAVMLKNRRIGISQSGIVEAFAKHGRRTMFEWCKRGYEFLRKLDEEYSAWLCIPRSIKLTTVKPSGTVSLLPGVTPGIHYPHSEYYIRRVRIARNSTLLPLLRKAGYKVEDDEYNERSVVVEFPVHERHFQRGKSEVSMWEQLENAAAYQRYWSDNQVSITVTFTKEEAKHIKYALELFEDKLKGVSFLPLRDHGYAQAPYEEITKEQYEEMVAKIKPIRYEATRERAAGVKYCDGDTCLL